MSLIQCTDPCVYQLDGRCTLVRAASQGQSGRLGCVNFVPGLSRSEVPDRDGRKMLRRSREPLQQRGQRLPDVGHPDQLQSLRSGQLPLDPLGDQALGKAQPAHLGQALSQIAHRAQLAG